jgi:hypothetical protein
MLKKQNLIPRAARPVTVEALEERKLFASALSLGINVTGMNSSTYSGIVKALRDTGTKSVRMWYGFSSYNTRSEDGVFKMVKALKSDGFDVMLAVVPRGGINGTESQVRGLFDWLVNDTGLKGSVDRWQVGNEPDHDAYWKGTVTSYVTKFLKPASEVIRAAGEKVVSAGPSWNPEDVKAMVDVGLLKYADYVGYHPYRSNLADLKAKVAEVKSYVGGKPLVASEWNIRDRTGNKTYWAQGVAEFWPVIRDNFYAAYYFTSTVTSSKAGPGGILNTNGSKNEPFYSTYKSFKNSFNGGSVVVPPAPTPTPDPVTPPTTGTTPSTVPSVASIQLWDASSDKIINSSVTNGMTIDLSKLSSKNLGFTATIGAGTKSVKFTRDGGTQTEGVAPFSMYGDGNNGKDIYGRAFSAGSFTFSAQPFSNTGGTGTAGTKRTFTINFVNGTTGSTPSTTVTPPSVSGFRIINASTGVALSGYSNITASTTIKLSSLSTRNIQILALASGGTESVKMGWTGRATRIENVAPYELFANSQGVASSWYATSGTYTVSATPYSADLAKGTAGSTKSVKLTFI